MKGPPRPETQHYTNNTGCEEVGGVCGWGCREGRRGSGRGGSGSRLERSSVEEWFCLTRPEIYDVGRVFTEVRAAHFPNQLVTRLCLSREKLFIHQRQKKPGGRLPTERKHLRVPLTAKCVCMCVRVYPHACPSGSSHQWW